MAYGYPWFDVEKALKEIKERQHVPEDPMEQKWKEYIDQKLSLLLYELETLNEEILKMKEKLGK